MASLMEGGSMTDHPITPPPELVEQWIALWQDRKTAIPYTTWFAQAAQWGADQELEACIDVLGGQWEWDILSQCTGWKEFRDQSEEILRAARRPKPPSLKEQALAVIENSEICNHLSPEHAAILRRALEALDD